MENREWICNLALVSTEGWALINFSPLASSAYEWQTPLPCASFQTLVTGKTSYPGLRRSYLILFERFFDTVSQAVNLLDFYWRPETCLRPMQIVVCWASEMLANDQLITIALCTGWDAGQMSHCYRLLGTLNTYTVQHGHQGIHFFVQILIQ